MIFIKKWAHRHPTTPPISIALTRLDCTIPHVSGDGLQYTRIKGRSLTQADEEVVGGSIVLMVETPRTRLQPGTDVEITLPTQQVPSFYGTLRSVIAVNKEWVMFHTRGHLGVDCLLLAPLDSTQISWWYRLRTRLAPDAWLDAFPPGLNHSVTPIPQFAPSRSPSPSTPPETPAPPPSFSLEDANSLLEKTARLIADQREAELRPWLRAGCPGQSVSFAEHVALIREMTEARQTATK